MKNSIRIRVDNSNELLGSPILKENFENILNKKFDKISNLLDRLEDTQTHYALFLLKNRLLIPKLNYFLKTTLTWKLKDCIGKMDNKIKTALISILNIELGET